jgi:hypothetical protein
VRCRQLALLAVLLIAPLTPRAAITVVGAEQNSVSNEIYFVGVGAAATATGGNVTPGLPAGTAVNDVLICVVESRDNVAHTMTGWTQLNTGTSGAGHRASLFWRRATGGDPTTVTHTAGGGIGARIIAFRGVSTTTAFDVANSFTVSASDDDVEAAAITTVTANTMLVFTQHMAESYSGVGTPTGSSPWTHAFLTEYDPSGGTNDLTISAHYGLRAATGSQPALQVGFTPTGGNAGVSHGAQLALRPAGTATALTINVPAGTTTGDVMVAAIALKTSSITITPPAGWTSLNRVNQAAGDPNAQELFYRVATGSEPASYTWNFSAAVFGAVGGVVSYRGVDTSSPIDVYGGNVTASATTHTATGVTTTTSNAMVVTAHSFASAETWTPPAGMTERVDRASITASNAAGMALEMSDVLQLTAGATGNKTATAAGNADTGVAQILALKRGAANYHYAISFPSGSTGSSCTQPVVQITGHDNSDGVINIPSGTTLSFSTSTGLGIWGPSGSSPLSGSGTWTPSGADDGSATYVWPGGESSVQVRLAHSTATGVYVNLSDGDATDKGNGDAEDPSLSFTLNPIIRITSDGSSAGTVETQIAGKGSNQTPGQTLYIQLKQSGVTVGGRDGCEVPYQYTGVTSVTVALECVNPTTCSGTQAVVNGTTIGASHHYASGTVPSPLVGTAVSFTLDGSDPPGDINTDNKAPLVFSFADAGQVRLHFSLTMDPSGPGSVTPSLTFTGATNAYVNRPFGYSLEPVDAGYTATDASGTVFKMAGSGTGADFNVRVRAIVWEAADDANLDGVPDSGATLTNNAVTANFGNELIHVTTNITHSLVLPASPGDPGTLSGGSSVDGFNTNGADSDANNNDLNPGRTTATLAFDEVGIIDLSALTSDYTGVTGANIQGSLTNVGRFVPDRFNIAANSPALQNDCAAGSYTYLDKNIYFATQPVLIFTALNTDGDVTENYGGSFWKLNSTLANRSYSDQVSGSDHNFSGLAASAVNMSGNTDYDGIGTLSTVSGANGDIIRYGRINPAAPFAANFNLSFPIADLTDTDGVCYDATNDGVCDSYIITNIGGANLRYGRLTIGTEVSSELIDMNVPLTAEYYNGASYVKNTNDVCTGIAETDLTLSNTYQTGETDGDIQICQAGGMTTMTITNNPFVLGDGLLSFSAPGAACTGFTVISVNLSALGLNHLRYDWDDEDGLNDGPYDDDPAGRASFGILSRPREIIYQREPWN